MGKTQTLPEIKTYIILSTYTLEEEEEDIEYRFFLKQSCFEKLHSTRSENTYEERTVFFNQLHPIIYICHLDAKKVCRRKFRCKKFSHTENWPGENLAVGNFVARIFLHTENWL